MKLNKKIWNQWLLLVVIIVGTGVACHEKGNGRPSLNMKPTFSITDKNPLGLYVAHRLMQMTFPNIEITKSNRPFYNYYYDRDNMYDSDHQKDIYAVITKQFYPNENDIYPLADFVRQGNTLFIASNEFDWEFLQKFHLTSNDLTPIQVQISFMDDMEETGVSIKDNGRLESGPYRFFFYPLTGEIKRADSFPYRKIVHAHNYSLGGIIFKYGSGRMIVVSNATAFTNYFLLTKNNYQYLLHLLSYLPDNPTSITWDTYYNKVESKKDRDNFSSFQELMKYPAMRWAFGLTILGGILLIIMALIRRQRAIPLIKPNINSSVEFVETVARLYLLKKNNKSIATKMITYFLEHIRNKYYINSSTINNEFVQLLTAKSGVSIEKTQLLINTINQIQTHEVVSDHLLLHLNEQLRQFIK